MGDLAGLQDMDDGTLGSTFNSTAGTGGMAMPQLPDDVLLATGESILMPTLPASLQASGECGNHAQTKSSEQFVMRVGAPGHPGHVFLVRVC